MRASSQALAEAMRLFALLTARLSRDTEASVQEGAAWLSLVCAFAWLASFVLVLAFAVPIPGWWFEHCPTPTGSAGLVLGAWYLVRPSSVPKSSHAVAILGILGGSYMLMFTWAWSNGPP
jgi:hypothetical protein